MYDFGMRRIVTVLCLLSLEIAPALAGPPFVSDDPEPTDFKHFEIYGFNSGTVTRGIDFNYGAAPDLQVTATVPAELDFASGSPTRGGLSNIELAAKCRFLHQSEVGWDFVRANSRERREAENIL